MNVTRAKSAGFCMGVDMALHKLDDVLKSNLRHCPVATFGPIIHNPQVLEHYASQGVTVAKDPEAIPPGGIVVVRAHGIPRQTQEVLERMGAEIVDATCPKVKKAQLLVRKMASEGSLVLLFGEADHPEVSGLVSYADAGYLVFETIDELRGLTIPSAESYCLASQTTQDRAEFAKVRKYLTDIPLTGLRVCDTICNATAERQSECIAMARTVDAMVVVGGFESGNTRRLAKVARDQGVRCLHVETADDPALASLAGLASVGLTAGASTPGLLIDEVERTLAAL